MLERFVPILKAVCLVLSALVLVQFSRLAIGKDPLRDLRIPAALSSVAGSTNKPASASVPSGGKETNAVQTNTVSRPDSPTKATNATPASKPPNAANRAMVGDPRQMPGMPGMKDPNLPPAIQARVQRITQSEILGPVIRPLPMALLGIGGNDAFVRAPNGQTGLLKEGEVLGGLKLLRIGTNRVLVEFEGQNKELMIFSGFGSETLLSKEKEKPQ